MPQKKEIVWDVLKLLNGNSIIRSTEIKGQPPTETTVENAYIIAKLKGELVLKYLPNDIQDTIYFLKNRSYLLIHGQGLIAPELLFSLSDKALQVIRDNKLPDEEEKAFEEGLWNFEPNFYGVGPNVSEGWKRIKKIFGKER